MLQSLMIGITEKDMQAVVNSYDLNASFGTICTINRDNFVK